MKGDMTITAAFERQLNTYEITVLADPEDYGTVSTGRITAEYGATVAASGSTLAIGNETVTATPADSDAQYTYSLSGWIFTDYPYEIVAGKAGGSRTVTGNMTVKAMFVRSVNVYTITVAAVPEGYGTVSQSTFEVEYGTSIVPDGNVLLIGGDQRCTATPADPDSNFRYRFVGWSFPAPSTKAAAASESGYIVSGEATITAVFGSEPEYCTVTVVKNVDRYGTISRASFTVPYGTEVSADGNVLTVGDGKCVAKGRAPLPGYVYNFKSWTIPSSTVTSDMTVKANFVKSVSQYTVTFAADPKGYGSVDPVSVTVPYGSAVSADGGAITVGKFVAVALPAESDAENNYFFVGWDIPAYTITEDMTVTASFGKEIKEYTVTVVKNVDRYGTISRTSFTVPYGTGVSADGNVLTVGGEQCFAKGRAPLTGYTYGLKSWTIPSDTVTEDMTVTANFARYARNYEVTVVADAKDSGMVSQTKFTVPYGTALSAADDTLTVGKYGESIATPFENSARWTYSFDGWDVPAEKVSGDVTVTALFSKAQTQ